MRKAINRKYIYWILQIGGWLTFSAILGLWNYFYVGIDGITTFALTAVLFVFGISVSHFYRYLLNRWDWLSFRIKGLIPRVVLASLAFSMLYSLLLASIMDVFFNHIDRILVYPYASLIGFISYFFIIYLLWSAIYLIYHYIRNYEREEVKNLKLEAANKEMELSNLKAQINPHFLFNAMNGIRALIDEDPRLAQDSLTRFSSLLRSALLVGKKELISLDEELSVVNNYLQLEGIRYEERLEYAINVNPSILGYKIPPFLIQTLVENAIKHGISNIPTGGKVDINILEMNGECLEIQVLNDGYFDPLKLPDTGIGLSNSRKRLHLLFGAESNLTIHNENNKVKARVTLPKILKL